jgi:hypothetical protein
MKTRPFRKFVHNQKSVQKRSAAAKVRANEERSRMSAIDAELEPMLSEPKAKISAAQIVAESRR